jgi:hypothetical protein
MKEIELITRALKDAYKFVKQQEQTKETGELLINLFKAEILVKNCSIPAVMSSAIAFAEWVDWNEYERFEGRRDLWYDKKSFYTNQLPIKTTEDLWNEFVKHCS